MVVPMVAMMAIQGNSVQAEVGISDDQPPIVYPNKIVKTMSNQITNVIARECWDRHQCGVVNVPTIVHRVLK